MFYTFSLHFFDITHLPASL